MRGTTVALDTNILLHFAADKRPFSGLMELFREAEIQPIVTDTTVVELDFFASGKTSAADRQLTPAKIAARKQNAEDALDLITDNNWYRQLDSADFILRDDLVDELLELSRIGKYERNDAKVVAEAAMHRAETVTTGDGGLSYGVSPDKEADIRAIFAKRGLSLPSVIDARVLREKILGILAKGITPQEPEQTQTPPTCGVTI